MQRIRIATRKSPLALWQAEAVSAALAEAHPGLACELVPMVTAGDRFLSARLTEVGGKNMFIKELEQAILEDRADIAVHSVKDVTADLPEGLVLAAFTRREDPFDAFVSNRHASFAALPPGARVGTASSRRQCQLLAARPDLEVATVRGNVNTRLAKLDAGDYDALVLAAAGLTRLGFGGRIVERFAAELMLPAVGQGVMGIECRADAPALHEVLGALADDDSTRRVRAERAVNARLGGGCHMPIAAFAERHGGELRLRALAGALDGSRIIRAEARGPAAAPEALGDTVGRRLIDDGALELVGAP